MNGTDETFGVCFLDLLGLWSPSFFDKAHRYNMFQQEVVMFDVLHATCECDAYRSTNEIDGTARAESASSAEPGGCGGGRSLPKDVKPRPLSSFCMPMVETTAGARWIGRKVNFGTMRGFVVSQRVCSLRQYAGGKRHAQFTLAMRKYFSTLFFII